MLTLKGKNIVITGASSGIGRQIAISCSKLGANLVLIARNKIHLEETVEKMEGEHHLMYSLDLEKYDSIEPIITDAIQKIGKLNGMVHSAGIEMTAPLNFMKPEHYEKLFSINVISGFELTRIVSKKKYLSQDGGSFIYIASIMGLLGESGSVAYSASKGALISGTKSLAIELAPKKIRINSISPGIVETEMTNKFFSEIPQGSKDNLIKKYPFGIGKPEDIANLTTFLLSDLSKWITGTNIVIDGGYSAQ